MNYISSKVILNQVQNWVMNGKEVEPDLLLSCISDGIEHLAVGDTLYTYNLAKKVENYRAELPCGMKNLLGILHNGCRLPYCLSRLDIRASKYETGNFYVSTSNVDSPLNVPQPFVMKLQKRFHEVPDEHRFQETKYQVFSQIDYSSEACYKLAGDVIHTSFKEGNIVIYYDSLPLDSDNYPLVPDNINVREALMSYVNYKLIEAGYEHPTINYGTALMRWEQLAIRAINSITYPTPDEMDAILRHQSFSPFKTL